MDWLSALVVGLVVLLVAHHWRIRRLHSDNARLFSLCPDALAIADVRQSDGRINIKCLNPVARYIVGQAPSPHLGSHSDSPLDTTVDALIKTRMAECARLGHQLSFECYSERWQKTYLVTLSPTCMNGSITRVFCSARDVSELKSVHRELMAADDTLSAVFNAAPLAILALDPSGRITRWNRAAEEVFGWSAEEVLGRQNPSIPEDERTVLHDIKQRALKGELANGLDVTRIRKDGSEFSARVFTSPIRSSTGELSGLVGIVADMTQHIRQTELLRRQALTFASINEAIVLADSTGRITDWNTGAETVFGYLREEVLGRNVGFIYAHHSSSPFDGTLDVSLLERGRWSGELDYRRKDGGLITCRSILVPLLSSDGCVNSVICVHRDITEEKRRERALCESEERFRLLAENASDIIFRTIGGPSYRVEYVSPAVREVLGYTPEEIYGNPEIAFLAVHPEDREAVSKCFGQHADLSRPVVFRFIKRSGKVVWLECRLALLASKHPGIVAIEGIARDITERRLTEDRLTYLSMHDSLTGLFNRTHFEQVLTAFEANPVYPVTIISTDMDGLKLMNDTLGHAKGDEILRAYAGVLAGTFRTGDVIARLGGDEFAIILPNADAQTGIKRADHLADKVWAYNLEGHEIPISVSIGVATAEDATVTTDELLRLADRRMYEDKIRRSSSSTRGLVKALLQALSTKDHIANGHAARVGSLARMLGQAVGLPAKGLADLALLSEVHDLGLVGTPDGILSKPVALSPEERELLQQHSTIGYKIARSSPELAPIAGLILHHHEWWNGEGYPQGLSGEGIPIECRILAIADAFDAMTNDRPYRKALSQSEALRELQRCAGTQFDPDLVQRFVSSIPDGFRDLAQNQLVLHS